MSTGSNPLTASAAAEIREARSWTYSYGFPPHTVYARELPEKGGVIQVRWTNPDKPGRDKRARHHLDMRVRKAPDAPVDQKLARLVVRAVIAANGRLVAGQQPFDVPVPEAPPERTAAEATQETLTITEGFELALHRLRGKFAAADESERYRDVVKLRDILLKPGMLDPNLRWADVRHEHVVELWRKMAEVHKKQPKKYGPRRAEMVIDALFSVATWLRRRSRIASNACVPVEGWRTEMKGEWERITGRPIVVKKPRHTADEARAIFAALWHPDRERYRALLACAKDGAVRVLHTVTREHLLRDGHGQAISLRVRVARKRRDGGEPREHSIRVNFDARARAAVREMDSPESASNAPLFALPLDALVVDPRIELAVELGGELRLGQVLRSRRSQLDLTSTALAPYGTFTVHGRRNKRAGTQNLTAAERAAVDRCLAGYLAIAEAEYDPGDPATDYYLMPAGMLVYGRATVERARAGFLTRQFARREFHALERAAGVTPKRGRAWYGLRRVATDEAPRFVSDRRVLDQLGGWTPGSTTREDTYQDWENELLRADTAAAREAWRTGGKTAAGALPVTSAGLLAALPEGLRAQILQHFGLAAAGTSVGTNEIAAETEGLDG